MTIEKPAMRPANPRFSSGPCAKIPGWTPDTLKTAFLGRSHRASDGKLRLKHAIDLTRDVLQVPDDYLIGIVPASDTGAVEMAMWSLLGRAWRGHAGVGKFRRGLGHGCGQAAEACRCPIDQRPLTANCRICRKSISTETWSFTWNGTTSGVRVPNGDFIPAGREGLTICDATSAAFAHRWILTKLDVVDLFVAESTGRRGRARHAYPARPRAVQRLETYTPAWPLPKIFRLTKAGKINAGIFPEANHQHPVHAVRRRLYQAPEVGDRRAAA